jgi:hypothetical protein
LLTGLVPFAVLCLLVGVWSEGHTVGWLVGGALALVLALLRFLSTWLSKGTVESFRDDVENALRSRRVSRILWGLVAVFLVFTAVVSTVNVESADVPGPVMVYRVDDSRGSVSAEAADPTDSVRLDQLHTERRFRVLIPPWGAHTWFYTSTQRRSSVVRVVPWLRKSLVYPDDFEALVIAAVLPMGNLMPELPLRLVVRSDDGLATTLADDTLRSIQAVLFSFVKPASPDPATRRRWTEQVSSRLGVDTSEVAPLVADWMQARWVKTRRPLREGERIRVILTAPRGDTLASDTVTLIPPSSDVILRRVT